MKADQQTQTEVTQVFKGMFEAYKKRDLQGVLSFWASDPDITAIGSGGDEKCTGVAQFSEQLKRDWAQGEIQSIGIKNFTVSAMTNVAWVSADIKFRGKTTVGAFDLLVRLTGVMENRYGRWLWVQMHVSAPNKLELGQINESEKTPINSKNNLDKDNGLQQSPDRIYVIVPRSEVESNLSQTTVSYLKVVIDRCAWATVEKKKLCGLEVTIDGYNNDTRELFEVQEVCDWAKKEFRLLPSIGFFLTEASKYSFCGWLCGPVSKNEITKDSFLKKFEKQWEALTVDGQLASGGVLRNAGADDNILTEIYFLKLNAVKKEIDHMW